MWVLDEEPVDVDSVARAGGLPGGSAELTNMVVMWYVFSLRARDRSDNCLLHQQGGAGTGTGSIRTRKQEMENRE